MIAARNGTLMSSSHTLSSLPLFPLGTVLYPGGILPLRVFEVRYLDMIGKCHKAGAPFGVVSLTQGGEVRQPQVQQVFSEVGTLATLTALEMPQPGLMTIRCQGANRFQITAKEQLPHGLWVADVRRLEADKPVPVPDDLQATADALHRLIQTLQMRAHQPDEVPVQMPLQLDDCGWVANRWCELLPLPVPLKQRLMELDNPLIRLELVSDVLSRTGIAN